ncbi:MAG: septation protein A [Planctomycetota bacterium]|nr:MAG: septation protein A [Planctomycetota bacterium]
MTEPDKPERPAYVRLAIEMGPLVLFFIANAKFGIMTATAVFMVSIVVSLLASLALEKRVPIMPMVTAVFVLVFGGLTLYLQDDLFIKLKPTIVNVMFAAILFGGLATGRAFLKPLFGTAMQLREEGWRALTLRWAFFFLVLAGLNEFVWRNFTTDTWVSFKVWGIMPLTILFMMTQMPLIQRYTIEEEPQGEA